MYADKYRRLEELKGHQNNKKWHDTVYDIYVHFPPHTRFDAWVADQARIRTKLDGAPIRGNTNKDEFDIRGGANKKLTYTGKRQFCGFETSVPHEPRQLHTKPIQNIFFFHFWKLLDHLTQVGFVGVAEDVNEGLEDRFQNSGVAISRLSPQEFGQSPAPFSGLVRPAVYSPGVLAWDGKGLLKLIYVYYGIREK